MIDMISAEVKSNLIAAKQEALLARQAALKSSERTDGQSTATKNDVKYTVVQTKKEDIPKIVDMINTEFKKSGAVLHVTIEEVAGWVNSGLSFVAKTQQGEIAGHSTAHIWPKSGWAELRAATVSEEYRGNGINKQLKSAVIDAIAKKNATTMVALKNSSSGGHAELDSRGFIHVEHSDIPTAIKDELLSIGKGQKWDIYTCTLDSGIAAVKRS